MSDPYKKPKKPSWKRVGTCWHCGTKMTLIRADGGGSLIPLGCKKCGCVVQMVRHVEREPTR